MKRLEGTDDYVHFKWVSPLKFSQSLCWDELEVQLIYADLGDNA